MSESPVEGTCGCQCGRYGCASRGGRPQRRAGITAHGLASGYIQGCRCGPCTSAHTEKKQRQKERKNALTRETARKNGQVWTSAELEMATRADLTAVEIAVMLGRTKKAVENMRRKCRTDPKFVAMLGASTAVE